MKDTIAAISTALGVGAISIIRVSGEDSISIVQKIWKGKNLEEVPTHTIHYGYIYDKEELIDEVLVSVMKAPKTFTKEDIIEIDSHGGISTTNRILELLLTNGCRLAEPGEFTKRAFLNGRIDLIEAEGVMDLISSKTDKSRSLALSQMTGNVSSMIHSLRKSLADVIANIEVNIDYPEYEDIEVVTIEKIKESVSYVKKEIQNILKRSETGSIIKEGIQTVIVGKPNVGKSSILNRLLEEEKAIVTEIAGTTRDIVEGDVSIDGILFHMIDTAGIRKTDDKVESIGVQKSLEWIEKADLVLFVLNNGEELTDEEKILLKKVQEKTSILIINKIDLEEKLSLPSLSLPIVRISALENDGIDKLRKEIQRLFHLEEIETSDYNYLSSARSISLLKQCLSSLDSLEIGLQKTYPVDMLEIDLKTIWNLLGEIIGETYSDELIDNIFSRFCLGK